MRAVKYAQKNISYLKMSSISKIDIFKFKKIKEMKSFDFQPGRILAGKYKIIAKLGGGWEGEVYRIKELNTGIERAAKIFYPERNMNNLSSEVYAKKLHKLRECPMVIKYHNQETMSYQTISLTILISEYVEGLLLTEYLSRIKGKRLSIFQGIHLLHALVKGIECIHQHGEYHGDLHSENIIIRRMGLSFELKVLDFFNRGRVNSFKRGLDIIDAIRIFYDAIGGQKYYKNHPKEIKEICCGLKQSLILKKFKTAGALRRHLETQVWS